MPFSYLEVHDAAVGVYVDAAARHLGGDDGRAHLDAAVRLAARQLHAALGPRQRAVLQHEEALREAGCSGPGFMPSWWALATFILIEPS